MVQELVGALRLKEKAREEGASYIVADSPGWVVEPAAQEFHVRMIDLLQPDVVIGFERGPELEGILVNFRRHPRIRIFECATPAEVVERKRDWRKLYRFQRFQSISRAPCPTHGSCLALEFTAGYRNRSAMTHGATSSSPSAIRR